MLPDIRFPHLFSKIVVRSAKTAIQDSGKSSFRVTGVGTGVLIAVLTDKEQQ